MRDYSEYVNQKYQEWTDKYTIPEHMEFELKTMFELEEQFRNQPPENVKTKRDILDMITRISGRFCNDMFKKKNIKPDMFKKKIEIIIAVNSDSKQLLNLLKDINAIKFVDAIGYKEIDTGKNILKIIEKDNMVDEIRGIKCHYYINFTGDKYFEETVLKQMLYK